jgi:ribosomal protein L19
MDYLLKRNFFNYLLTDKYRGLAGHTRLAGFVLQVDFHQEYTKFEVTDFIKVSKKHRSNTFDIIAKDIPQYNFTGLCLRYRPDPYSTNTAFLIRNVFDQFPCEYNIPLYSPIITGIHILLNRPKIQRKIRSKYYFLRNKPLPMSKLIFSYILGYDIEIVQEEHVVYTLLAPEYFRYTIQTNNK